MLDSLLEDTAIKERLKRLKAIVEKSTSGEGQSLKNLNILMVTLRK
jgi:hypothetical protein